MSRTYDQERKEDSDRARLKEGWRKLEEWRRILEMAAERLPTSTIATRLGLCRKTVERRKREVGLVGNCGRRRV